MTETEARAAGHRVGVGERRMDRVSRAVEEAEGGRGLSGSSTPTTTGYSAPPSSAPAATSVSLH
jgi:hypothetical protein